ncbi:MAG: GIY-YIG nuclease family protein, partial [Bacteroidales bacterium]|nr:GIY-YIG nuclease family protein [Bacteroidales bacterium]
SLPMYWVYALYSRDFDKIYVGSTSDLTGRLNAHNHPANHESFYHLRSSNTTFSTCWVCGNMSTGCTRFMA